MLKKILKYTFLLLLAAAIIGGITFYFYLKNIKPKYKGKIELNSMSQDVTVKFDTYGIPHIYADNGLDAYRALGYVHAQDRLFQMEMIRRVSGGTLAEVLGEKLVKTDKFFRILGIRKMAQKNADHNFEFIEHDWQRHTLAYLEGVNEFVEFGSTPIEYTILGMPKKKFEPVDVYSILGYMGLGFSRALKDDPLLEKIRVRNGEKYFDDWLLDSRMDSITLPEVKNNDLSNLIPHDVEAHLENAVMPLWYGSNCWVVSPEKSSSGQVILSNDTHIGISQPSVWYEAHLNYPGFEFYGNHIAGVPFGVIGHTNELGWGLTIFPFDGIDLYREKYNPENNEQVWENDKWVDLEIQNETIICKDGEDINFERKLSRHGPIINDVASAIDTNEANPISFWWNYFSRPTSTLQALHAMNYSKNIDDVRQAVEKIDFIGLNVLYGDKKGNIAHWATGRIPKRPDHVNPKFILDGASGKDEILGYYDFKENPQEENPPSGIVASANNDPGTVNNNYFHGYYCPPNRYNRIIKHLESKEKWSQEDMKSIQLDGISDDHLTISRLLTSVLRNETSDLDDIKNSILTSLEQWDGSYSLEKVEPTIYTKLIYHTMHNAMVDEVGKDDFNELQASYNYKASLLGLAMNEHSIWWDDITTDGVKETRKEAIENAFNTTIKELQIQLGDNWKEWKWERVHTITHKHPLGAQKPLDKYFNVGPFPVTGGNDVPNKMMYKVDATGVYEVYSSPALRILLDFADVDNSESINPTGQSGNVMSPHYMDQTIMFNEGIYRAQLMNEEQIDSESRILLLQSKK